MGIAVLTPTRERPRELAAMLTAIATTCTGPVTVYVGADDDDPTLPAIKGQVQNARRVHAGVIRINLEFGPRQQLGPWTNELVAMACDAGDTILASFGDDHRPRTHGWDNAVTEAMSRMGGGLVYTRDGLQDERLPTAPFWSTDMIRALGWYFPPVLKHLYADDFWLRFARDLGRCKYLPDVLIEHLHPVATGAEPDEINRANDAHYPTDELAFRSFVDSNGYQDALARVRSIL